MTGTVKMVFNVATIAEAKEKALAEWRKLLGDESADLEWDTDFQFTLTDTESLHPTVSVKVTVELDDLDTILAVAKT